MLEFFAQALEEDEALQRFMAAKVRGNAKQALKMLDELDGMGL